MNIVPLKSDDALRILNMVYSVFFAILARFAIQQTGGVNGEPLKIHVLVSQNNWIPVTLLCTYFIFDWLTANISLPLKGKIPHLLVPLMMVGILALGGLVAFAFVPSGLWALLVGVYVSLTPWYDIIGMKSDDENNQGLGNCMLIYAVIFLRLVTGVFFLSMAMFKLWLHPESPVKASDGWLLIWLCIYVILKLIRYSVLLPLYCNHSNK